VAVQVNQQVVLVVLAAVEQVVQATHLAAQLERQIVAVAVVVVEVVQETEQQAALELFT
jgi:hypothetical protein